MRQSTPTPDGRVSAPWGGIISENHQSGKDIVDAAEPVKHVSTRVRKQDRGKFRAKKNAWSEGF